MDGWNFLAKSAGLTAAETRSLAGCSASLICDTFAMAVICLSLLLGSRTGLPHPEICHLAYPIKLLVTADLIEPQGLNRVCENLALQIQPRRGDLKVAQDASPWDPRTKVRGWHRLSCSLLQIWC